MGSYKQIKLVGIIFDDFTNYQYPCMTLETPYCDFKCDRECGVQVCQNCALAHADIYTYEIYNIIRTYLSDDITKAIVFQGLEPFDNRSFQEVLDFIDTFREYSSDDIIIYTGFKEEEIGSKIDILKKQKNIIVKFGRFIPDQPQHFDEVLGIDLASPNQYARRIS
jgi:hypothetical protein